MTTIDFIKQVLLAFEQSRTFIKYDAVYLLKDGPDDIEQVTLSFGLTEFGNLKKFIRQYCLENGKFAKQLNEFIPLIGDIKTPLASNKEFISLLKQAGSDPVMQQCQEKTFHEMYIAPSQLWCQTNKLTLPLSQLVVADSYLHSGSILNTIRNMFSEPVPARGGREQVWIENYCRCRRNWLSGHSRQILRKTTYRMDFMLGKIREGDWKLEKIPCYANGVKIG